MARPERCADGRGRPSQPNQFVAQFRAATGLPLHRYDITTRVERAKLLPQSDLSLAEFTAFALSPEAKAWIDRSGNITYGPLPRRLTLPR
jgi:hypothetical protein